METRMIRWGILGCGKIARKFCASMTYVENSLVVGGASKNPDRSIELARDCGLDKTYGSYEELVADPLIDAVYVATTHNWHLEVARMALLAGKAVLCEKPLTVSAREAQELVDLAKHNRLLLMEAMWTRFLPVFVRLKQLIDQGKIGQIKQFRADFCVWMELDPENRCFNPDLAGGGLLDLGIYSVSLASFIMNGQQPNAIRVVSELGNTGVDEQVFCLFKYDSGVLGSISCAMTAGSRNGFEVSGTEGRLLVPTQFFGGNRLEFHSREGDSIVEEFPMKVDEGFRYEIEAFNAALLDYKTEVAEMTPLESLEIAKTMDRIRFDFES